MLQVTHEVSAQLLDVGCGSKPYRHLFLNVDRYIGLEFDTPENRAANYTEFLRREPLPF